MTQRARAGEVIPIIEATKRDQRDPNAWRQFGSCLWGLEPKPILQLCLGLPFELCVVGQVNEMIAATIALASQGVSVKDSGFAPLETYLNEKHPRPDWRAVLEDNRTRFQSLPKEAGFFRDFGIKGLRVHLLREAEEFASNGAGLQGTREAISRLYRDSEALELVEEEPAVVQETEGQVPELPEECIRPGFADFCNAYTECTEGSDSFFFLGYFVVVGLALGRSARLEGALDIFPNIYGTNVGVSGRDRKSTAQRYAARLLAKVAPHVEHSRGVGSPEGLIGLLAGKDGAPRPALLEFGETASLLRKAAQDGSRGLPPLLADAFDCPPSLRLPNRKEDLAARDPFLSIYGSTTPEWYTGALTLEDARGGLPGRFIYVTGKPKLPIPFPPPPDLGALSSAEGLLVRAVERHRQPRAYGMSKEAKEIWAQWYREERARTYPNDLLGVIAQRLHLHAWKLALVFAALEGDMEINADQIRAACKFSDYQREVQAHVFAGFGDSETVKVDSRIIAQLRKRDLAGWELQQRVRHVDSPTLARRLAALAQLGTIQKLQRGRGEVWHLIQRSE